METMKTSNFTCQAKSFSGIFFTYQVCELHPFSCHVLAKYDIYSQTAESVLSHLNLSHQKIINKFTFPPPPKKRSWNGKFHPQKNPSTIPVTWNLEYSPWGLSSPLPISSHLMGHFRRMPLGGQKWLEMAISAAKWFRKWADWLSL